MLKQNTWLVGFGLLLACGGSHGVDAGDASLDSASSPTSITLFADRELDVLLMIDNTLAHGQASLSEQFPRLLRVLSEGELVRPDGSLFRFVPISSVRFGVVTTDMGTGGVTIPSCIDSRFGHDGVLRTQGNVGRPGCMATYPPFMTFEPTPDASAADVFAADLSCVAAPGHTGCGFEQPLESILKALTPSTSALRFAEGSVGHGDGANAGFLRPNSLLTLVVLTDEDDCSVLDPELFDPDSTRYPSDFNLRCTQHPEALHPIERYVDGLLAARGDAKRLLYAPIAGVPTDLVADPDDLDYDVVLVDERMLGQIDPTMPTRPVPACNRLGLGLSFPGRRVIRLAQALEERGAGAVLQSICQEDFAPVINAIVQSIAASLDRACLPRALAVAADGRVSCEVLELLPSIGDITQCSQLADRGREATPLRVEADGRQLCRIEQLSLDPTGAPPAEPGWYYDDTSDAARRLCTGTPQRLAFTMEATPIPNADVRFECP